MIYADVQKIRGSANFSPENFPAACAGGPPPSCKHPPRSGSGGGRGQLSAPALTFGGELTGAAVVHLIMLRLGQRDQIPSAIGKFRIILGRPDVVHDLRRDRHAEAQTLLAEMILAQDLSAEPPPSVVFPAVIKSRQRAITSGEKRKSQCPRIGDLKRSRSWALASRALAAADVYPCHGFTLGAKEGKVLGDDYAVEVDKLRPAPRSCTDRTAQVTVHYGQFITFSA